VPVRTRDAEFVTEMINGFAFAVLGDGDRASELFSMLNPIHHTTTRAGVQRYKVEPYVVCADVYSVAPHVGRGGWTWYTGSAGWMYRLIIESLLGLQRQGARLLITPRIPRNWATYSMDYRFGESRYHIEVVQTGDGASEQSVSVTLDGVAQDSAGFALVDDNKDHAVEVRIEHGDAAVARA
jgi:cellobiose phosphorylase